MLKYIVFAFFVFERISSITALNTHGCGKSTDNLWENQKPNSRVFVQFPWTVIIGWTVTMDIADDQGSLIHPQVVLTSAFTIKQLEVNASIASIRAGIFDQIDMRKSEDYQERRVLEIIMHEKQKHNEENLNIADNDFALLVLVSPVVLNNNVNTVCLPNLNFNIIGRRCIIIDSYGGEMITQEMEILNSDCKDSSDRGSGIISSEDNICVKHKGSRRPGPPLVCLLQDGVSSRYTLVAHALKVDRYLPRNPNSYTDKLYMNVAKIRDWIDEKMDYFDFNKWSYSVGKELNYNSYQNRDLEVPLGLARGYCGYRNFHGVGWKVVILKTDRECGGSLIHPWVILTAAQCVNKLKPDKIEILADERTIHEENSSIKKYNVSKIIIHGNYSQKNSNIANDFALLFLSKPVESTENIKTACLPDPNSEYKKYESQCFLSGWGRNFSDGGDGNRIYLNEVKLPIVARDNCENAIKEYREKNFKLDRSNICAGDEAGQDACNADPGTPLICPDPAVSGRYAQFGILSWGVNCGKTVPGVYANIVPVRKWIDEELKNVGLVISSYTSH